MDDTSYRVVPGLAGCFDVQMVRPGGQLKTAAGFGSEHEANAWIVQAKRMKREAAPWTPLVPRKPAAAVAGDGGGLARERSTLKS